jgi:hypothetical protein
MLRGCGRTSKAARNAKFRTLFGFVRPPPPRVLGAAALPPSSPPQELTTSRVLTMEFIHGVKPNDVAALRKAGISPAKVCPLTDSYLTVSVPEIVYVNSSTGSGSHHEHIL